MNGCLCAALADLAVLSYDPREETRLRRTLFGIEIQRWRLASTMVIPDAGTTGAACDAHAPAGDVPRAGRGDKSKNENIRTEALPTACGSHEPA